jgi:hypothetical protein
MNQRGGIKRFFNSAPHHPAGAGATQTEAREGYDANATEILGNPGPDKVLASNA